MYFQRANLPPLEWTGNALAAVSRARWELLAEWNARASPSKIKGAGEGVRSAPSISTFCPPLASLGLSSLALSSLSASSYPFTLPFYVSPPRYSLSALIRFFSRRGEKGRIPPRKRTNRIVIKMCPGLTPLSFPVDSMAEPRVLAFFTLSLRALQRDCNIRFSSDLWELGQFSWVINSRRIFRVNLHAIFRRAWRHKKLGF